MKKITSALFAGALLGSITITASAQITAVQVKTEIQPSLALTYVIDPNAFVHIFAGDFTPGRSLAANGQLLSIASNTVLFSQLGTEFGGNGVTNFRLPDLNGRVALGSGTGPGLSPENFGASEGAETVTLTNTQFPSGVGGLDQTFDNLQPSLNLRYMIALQGAFPSRGGSDSDSEPFVGQVALFAGAVAPPGWAFANGQFLSISSNTALFSLLGTNFGGNGLTNFQLPDLRGRVPIGAGAGPGLTPRDLGEVLGEQSTTLTNANIPSVLGGAGQPYNNMQPSLGLNFLVTGSGIYPVRDGGSGFSSGLAVLGEVTMFAGNFAPSGRPFADGSLLAISGNEALFSLLGTQFGGNGVTTFALPDLRGRDVIGAFSGSLNGLTHYVVGQTVGVESIYLDATAPTPPPITPVPEPSTYGLIGAALLGGIIALKRRKAKADAAAI